MGEQRHRLSRRTFLGGAVVFGAVSLVNPAIAFATPTSAEKQAEADAVRVQVSALEEQLIQASENYNTALTELETATALMEESQVRINEKTEEIVVSQGKLGTRARSMYRSGSTSFLDVLFGSATFEEFTTNWDILNQMNQDDATLVEKTKILRDELEEEKTEYERQKEIAAAKTEECRTIKEAGEAAYDEMSSILNSLDEEARQLLEAEQQAAAEAAAAAERARLEAETRAVDNNRGGSESGNSGGGRGYTYNPDIPAKGSVVDYAESRLGCPYDWGASGPNAFDCSGLTSWCYQQVGIWISRTSETQYASARAVMPVSSAEPGDVLYRYGHVGICTDSGGGSYIHAPQTGDVVRYGSGSAWSAALRF